MNKKLLILIVAVFLFLVWFAPGIANLLTDWFWFQSLGFGNVFSKIISTKVILFLVSLIAGFFALFINLKIASDTSGEKSFSFKIKGKDGETTKKIKKGSLNKISLFISGGVGFLISLAVVSNWKVVLKFFNSVPFNQVDPILGKDISYYLFSLPFWELILGAALWILFISLIGVSIIYLKKGVVSIVEQAKNKFYASEEKKKRYRIKTSAQRHLSILLFLLFLVAALQVYLIRIPSLLSSSAGLFTGASFVDIHARLPVLRILMFILLGLALVSAFNFFKKKVKYLGVGVAAFLLVSVFGGAVYPYLLQKFIVAPNELNKEAPYIENHIEATQQAFGIGKVKEKKLSGEGKLSMKDINQNEGTIKNIRLWDRKPLLDTFGQIQEIRTYYDFSSIDDDRYGLGEEYRQVLLSPRELKSSNLPNPNFINKHLTFTHGFGLTLGPVNKATEKGLPLLFVKNIPPTSSVSRLKVNRPEIYYGEQSSNYVIVDTFNEEFDYPSGSENIFSSYKGNGGVKIKNIFRKFLFAIDFQELKILFSDDIKPESQIMYHRKIKERVKRIFPFLKLDSDPYLVITKEGKLKWIVDAYTKSSNYPYSAELSDGTGYMRNSVKATVDAYSGDVKFYMANSKDPIIRTYANIFPDTFLKLSEMPEDLKKHIRYPEDIFAVQSKLYATYHMEEPRIFYNKEDKWEIPRISDNRGDPMMRHIVMKLPNEDEEEFIFMIPFTPQKKDNMAGWLAARSDGKHYGELVTYKFPKQRLVFGPNQITNRISQDTEISRQISLWDQRGSEVNLGPLLVIPIEESLIYVRPLYLRGGGGNIPELKRVIVAYKDKIAMRKTLDEAIEAIFTGKKLVEGVEEDLDEESESTQKQTSGSQELIDQAQNYYQKALEAQQKGNWSEYGEYIQKLGKTLEKIKNNE